MVLVTHLNGGRYLIDVVKHLHLMQRLRTCGAIPPLLRTSPWQLIHHPGVVLSYAQGQFHLHHKPKCKTSASRFR